MFNTIKNLLFPPSNNSGTQDTTQDFVNIESIHENMIINKSGIAIMMIGLEAISRELMTEKEQVIQAFPSLTGVIHFLINYSLYIRCKCFKQVSVPYRGHSFFNYAERIQGFVETVMSFRPLQGLFVF